MSGFFVNFSWHWLCHFVELTLVFQIGVGVRPRVQNILAIWMKRYESLKQKKRSSVRIGSSSAAFSLSLQYKLYYLLLLLKILYFGTCHSSILWVTFVQLTLQNMYFGGMQKNILKKPNSQLKNILIDGFNLLPLKTLRFHKMFAWKATLSRCTPLNVASDYSCVLFIQRVKAWES